MDNSNDEYIRPPDQIKIERLIDDNLDISTIANYNYVNPIYDNKDYDLNTILKISKLEFDAIQEEEEKKTIDTICNQIKQERHSKFNNMKCQLNKIILFDRENIDYYELILSIIEMFELGVINEYKTNENKYKNIFRILKSIRLPINEIDNLKKIIIIE